MMGFTSKHAKLTISTFVILVSYFSLAMSRSLSLDILKKHESWMAKHGRTYSNKLEKDRRLEIFKRNMEYVERFNSEGSKTFKLSLNQFSDLTLKEFAAHYAGGGLTNISSRKATSFRHGKLSVDEIPPSMDWREKGVVTDIKNQGRCGSCWAFSAVATIESLHAIRNGQLISLSQQQLLDCVGPERNDCRRGYIDDTYKYVKQNRGISAEYEYPYKGWQDYCNQDGASHREVQISDYERLPTHKEEALLKAVTVQPVSVLIDATSYEFAYYSRGVFPADYCSTNLDHFVTVVGYGVSEDSKKYWLIKNSWGKNWGEDGYMRLERDTSSPEGACGITLYATYPVA